MPPALQPLRLSPAQRFAAVFVPALLVLAFGAATWWGTLRERRSRIAVDQSHRTLEALDSLVTTLVNAETGQRGYLLTGRDEYLDPFRRADGEVHRHIGRLRTLAGDDPPIARARVDSLSLLAGRKFDELNETITLARNGRRDAALAIVASGRGRNTMEAIRRTAASLAAGENAELAQRAESEERTSSGVALLIVLGAAGSALVSLLLNRVLHRYGETQAAFAAELETANHQLEEQQAELEMQYEQLQEQSTELEAQSAQLQEQGAELAMQNDALQEASVELQRRTDAAEEANRVKARFLAAMSHDLRTPLNAIAGYADLLEMGIRGPVNQAQIDDLARIRNSTRHLLSLITGILDFARVEAGHLEVRVENVPLAATVRGVESSILPQAAEKGVRFETDPGADEVWVEADPEKVVQVLLNLVGNAIKFTGAGGEVALSCVEDGDEMVAIHVRDTGRGIPPGQLPTIFEPFVQVDREQVAERQRGVGLGLAISRELAVAMGGALSVQSEPGKGSIFTLRLRRAANPHALPQAAPGAGEAGAV
ncbi:CHASE3 domain-containing protein [Longimicrobium sp.]|uniref:sensor histidine kinase n=1 Tax=Longimicrobium sp. TaxID=2029185 RepID=UPI002C5CF475|nr:CHASE3 domain-containing protein [Longimicrobium sp.]HSU14768.1 CHASE3 domain-containing protein [Longimicrobium sp.]